VSFELLDAVRNLEERHCFERGLVDYGARLSLPLGPLHAPWYFEGETRTTRVRLCLQWCRVPGRHLLSWVNQHRSSAGTHLRGLDEGLWRALCHYARVARRESELSLFEASLLTEGLTVLLDVTVPQPVWLGPVMGTLANAECEGDLARLVEHWLSERFEQESAVATQVLEHFIGRCVARG